MIFWLNQYSLFALFGPERITFSCQVVILNFNCTQGAVNDPEAQPAPQIDEVNVSSPFSFSPFLECFISAVTFLMYNSIPFLSAACSRHRWHEPLAFTPWHLAAQGCLLQISAELCPGTVFFQVTFAAQVQDEVEVMKVTSVGSSCGALHAGWDTFEAVLCCPLGFPARSNSRCPQW